MLNWKIFSIIKELLTNIIQKKSILWLRQIISCTQNFLVYCTSTFTFFRNNFFYLFFKPAQVRFYL